ncbi:hypothetical protein BCR42DRAFT_154794 [Absidia repens]|uniref:Uncharacterized protein n=1 Tax=Absidia repens TaxID=90262 RepID=A0A1X2I2R4_9FUNG|nr:hypothetical protein BCR42DRAFT_154794 [Absidia repens]
MVLKSSILACVLAGVTITHALPMSGNKVTIDKRHKKPLPTALPAAANLTPDQQFVACLVNTLYNPPKDKDDRLEYEELINGCIEVVYKTKPAPAAASGVSEQAGPSRPEEPLPDSDSPKFDIGAADTRGDADIKGHQVSSHDFASSSPPNQMAPNGDPVDFRYLKHPGVADSLFEYNYKNGDAGAVRQHHEKRKEKLDSYVL